MINLAIFASGGGSNAEQIIEYFRNHAQINVSLIVSNRRQAYVLERAKRHQIKNYYISREHFNDENKVLSFLHENKIDYIILAGFLLLVPPYLISSYKDKIINIHPALLPKYGGKGMYGHHVHQAVFDNFEKQSGITIHLVNELYDEGKVLFQASVDLEVDDTPDVIASKVLKLEHHHFPEQIEKYILAQVN